MKTKHSQLKKRLLASALMGALLTGSAARADDSETLQIIKQLQEKVLELEHKVQTLEQNKAPAQPDAGEAARQRIQELDQKVKVLERNRELDQESAEAKAKDAPKISIGGSGFSFGSADDAFSIQLKGVLQVDSRTFFNDGGIKGNDTFLIRRLRPILQGTVYRDFDYYFVPDFAGSTPQLFDAYLNYKYSPALQIRAGKFKVPVGIEQLQSDPFTLFNERGMPTALTPNRDIGFQLHGEVFGGLFSYAAGIFNGLGDGRNSTSVDFEDNKEFAGRIFFQPFKKTSVAALQGFGFGLGGSYETMQGTNIAGLPATTGGTLAGYATDGQQQFFAYNPATGAVVANGEHWRLSPQGSYFFGPFGFLGEYVISDQRVSRTAAPLATARLENTAWGISGSWFLTGEDASYNGPVAPIHTFNPGQGDWGAWQLVARYQEVNIDEDAFPLFSNPTTSAHAARGFSLGVNWWLNRNVKVATSFSHTTFSGGGGAGASAPAAVTRREENALFTRVQLAF